MTRFLSGTLDPRAWGTGSGSQGSHIYFTPSWDSSDFSGKHEKSGGFWEGRALASVTWHRNLLLAHWAGSLRQAERSVEARTCFYGAHLFLDGCLPELERIR